MNCKNCIHWGKCSKTNGKTRYYGETIASDNVEELCEWFISTADVVPKSEVERLEHILNSYALQYGTVTEQQEVIDKTKEEVAWEIFAEIDNILYRFAYPSLTAIGTINVINAEGYHLRTRDYAELKKKYTENKE